MPTDNRWVCVDQLLCFRYRTLLSPTLPTTTGPICHNIRKKSRDATVLLVIVGMDRNVTALKEMHTKENWFVFYCVVGGVERRRVSVHQKDAAGRWQPDAGAARERRLRSVRMRSDQQRRVRHHADTTHRRTYVSARIVLSNFVRRQVIEKTNGKQYTINHRRRLP